MTIGPEPMMRILLMSVLLGIVESCGGRRRREGGRGFSAHALPHGRATATFLTFRLESPILVFCSLPESVSGAPAAFSNGEGNTRAGLRKVARRFAWLIPR